MDDLHGKSPAKTLSQIGSDIRRRFREKKGSMLYTLDLLHRSLRTRGKRIHGSKVALLGFPPESSAYDADDTAQNIRRTLLGIGADVLTIDTSVMEFPKYIGLKEALHGSDAVIIAVDHRMFRALRPKEFRDLGIDVVIPTSLHA